MSLRREAVVDAALRTGEIGIAAGNRQTARLVVGRHDDQRSGRAVGEVHRRGHRPVEIAHLGQQPFGVVAVACAVDQRTFDHQQESPAALAGNPFEQFHRLARRARQEIAPLGDRESVELLLVHGAKQPPRRDLLGLVERLHDPVSAPGERLGIGSALVAGLLQIPPAAAQHHVDPRRKHVARDGLRLPAVSDMRVERRGCRMLKVGHHGQARGHIPLRGALHHRMQRIPFGIEPQHAVVRLPARRQRRTGRRRIGDAVVGRVGRDERHALGPVEGRGFIAVFDLEHRYLRQPHAVADQINHIAHAFRGGLRRQAPRREQKSRQKKYRFLHNGNKVSDIERTFYYIYATLTAS